MSLAAVMAARICTKIEPLIKSSNCVPQIGVIFRKVFDLLYPHV